MMLYRMQDGHARGWAAPGGKPAVHEPRGRVSQCAGKTDGRKEARRWPCEADPVCRAGRRRSCKRRRAGLRDGKEVGRAGNGD